MKRSARIMVLVSGDRLVEGRVRGAIQRCRGSVETVERERTSAGFVRYGVEITFDAEESLRALVMGIESIPGAAVQDILEEEPGNPPPRTGVSPR